MTLKPIGRKQNKPRRGITFVASLVRNRELWWRLTEREVIGRYRGSILGWVVTIEPLHNPGEERRCGRHSCIFVTRGAFQRG